MSSKRQRGATSCSRQTVDRSKFISSNAAERFNKVLDKKTLVLERGLRLDANLDGDMAVMIAERNWFKLVEQPGPAVIPIVKEFYANVIERVESVVQVRQKPVAFDNDTINAYYGLKTPDLDDLYEDLCPCLDDIL